MNILFAGTPANSAEILNSLAKVKHINIKGVLTQPDKRGNRGNNVIESIPAHFVVSAERQLISISSLRTLKASIKLIPQVHRHDDT